MPFWQFVAEPKQTLSAKQAEAIAHLSGGEGVIRTAELVGISRVTLWEWGKLPEFKAALDAVRASRIADINAEIAAAGDDAMRTMAELSKAADKDSVRFSAAKYILDRLLGSPTQTLSVTTPEAAAWLSACAPGSDEEEGE